MSLFTESSIDGAFAAGRLQEPREITLAWLSCADQNDINLEGAGTEVVSYLRAAGVGLRQMAITTPTPPNQWPQAVRRLGLVHRVGRERLGQATYRLALTERGVSAASGRAATVSVVGIGWWLALARSALLSLATKAR